MRLPRIWAILVRSHSPSREFHGANNSRCHERGGLVLSRGLRLQERQSAIFVPLHKAIAVKFQALLTQV